MIVADPRRAPLIERLAGPDVLAALVYGIAALAALATVGVVLVLVLRALNDRHRRRWRAHEARWERDVLDALVDDQAAARLVRGLARRDRLYFAEYLSRIARRVRGAERERLTLLAEPVLPALTRELRHRQPERRARAVHTLALLGDPTSVGMIVRALDDSSSFVVVAAVRALAVTGAPEAGRQILARLDRVTRWDPNYLAHVLARFGDALAPDFRAIVQDEQAKPRARHIALLVLTLLHDVSSAALAARVLAGGAEGPLARAAVQLLGDVGGAEQLDEVRARRETLDPVLREGVVRVLASIGDAGDVATLRDALLDPQPTIAYHAARGLLARGEVAAVEAAAEGKARGALAARQAVADARRLATTSAG